MPSCRKTRLAEDDIVNIYKQGVRDFGPRQAEIYHAELADAFDLIASHPQLAPERHEFDPPIRLHRHRAHHILYLIDAGVLIVRVLPRLRRWEQLMGTD
ncbi:type II toxin-antitoxin system RelE/ParE family toxin [Acetobacter pasteurianus]|uniref:type II toxin-antitoxin system RelE/ParE family toxin n=1 Tax=Acetobacter pasteurianus TaxID=438 RepID=UPI003D1077FE